MIIATEEVGLLTLRMCHFCETYQYHLTQSEYVFASMINMTAPTKIKLRSRKGKCSQCHLLLLIRLDNLLMQLFKVSSTLLGVVLD